MLTVKAAIMFAAAHVERDIAENLLQYIHDMERIGTLSDALIMDVARCMAEGYENR